MKNLVLATALGTLAGTFAIPALAGPIHFAVTKPFSMFGWLPVPNPSTGMASITLGTAPMDFVITDVLVSNEVYYKILVTVNGAPVLCLGGRDSSPAAAGQCHLNTGIPVPRGATVAVDAGPGSYGSTTPSPVTVAGYVE